MTPNVYCVNKSGHDFSEALKFGDIIYLSDYAQPRFNTNNIYRTFKPILEASNQDDYILLTGLTVMNVIACSIFAILHNRLNLLIHQVEGNSYKARILDLHDIQSANIEDLLKEPQDD